MPPSSHRSGSPSPTESASGEPNYIDIDIRNDMAELLEVKRSQPRGRRVPSPQGWVGAATDLHINLRIDIGDRSFLLHEFPLLSKSEKLNRLVFESRDTEKDHIILSDIPGGADTFELVTRFLYGGKFELTPYNVAALRCAADYLEMSDVSHGNGGLVALTENYLNLVVTGSWRDSIIVLKSCAELAPWADDLEILRRCSESVAWKCSTDPHGIRWSFSGKEALRDWWFRDVCSLSIDTFSKVIQALTAKGLNQTLLAAVVGCYAEKWLSLASGSDMLTTLKTKEESQQASFVAFTGFNQDIVARDAKKAQLCKSYRAIIQGIVKLLPPQPVTMSVKLLVKLLRVACAVDAGSLCKTDLVKRIAPHLDKLSLEDLLIPSSGESTYDVDVFQQILEFYLQQKNYASSSPPFSPRSTVSGSSTSGTASTSSLSRSISGVSATDLSSHSGSSLITESSSDRSVSGSSTSDSSSIRSSGSGSSITGSSSISSSRSGSSSFVSTSSETTDTSRTSSRSSSETSSPNLSGDEGVKAMPEKKFFLSTEGHRMRSHLAPTTTNFKLGQLLEMYLMEVARDSTISLGKFITLADLVTEFPRDSDDGIYRVIDTYLRAHPSLNEVERRKLCRVMDTGALSLAACVHAASNERLPLRVVIQVLFSEQIKLRNAMTGNEVMIDKEVETTRPPQFSSTTSTTNSSDPTTTTSSSSATFSVSTKSRTTSTSTSTSSASGVNPSLSSVASSQLPGGLNMKDTLRSVTAEVDSLKKQVKELEIVKSHLSLMESLQLEIHSLSSRFQEMTHDYTGMTHQVEELTKASKHKSGWSSGWKKVTKSFHLKDNHDYTTKLYMEQHHIDTTPAPRGWPIDIPVQLDISQPVALRSTKSDIVRLPKTPGDSNLPPKQELLLNPKLPKSESKPDQEAVIDTLNVPVKDEPVIETELSIKNSSNVSADMPEQEIPTSTPARPEALETSLDKPKDRSRDDSNVVTNLPRRRRQARSTSPVRSPRHHYDSDSSSVTSTSSYTSTSTSTSVSSFSSHGHNRASGSRHHRRSEGHRRDKSPTRSGGHHNSSVHKSSDKSPTRSGGHHNSSVQKSSERSAGLHSRKHRQKEGSEHHSHQSHHSGHHHSLDSYPRHSSSKDHHRSHHSSQRRKDPHAKEVPSKPSSQRRRRPRPHHKEVCSDSDSSTDSGSRRRHR